VQGIHRMELYFHEKKMLLKYNSNVFTFVSPMWQIDLPECE
jgi:hypothetical protein